MATIYLANNTFALDYSVATTATSPEAAYSAWAAALGVSDTATLQAFNGDDEAFNLTQAASFIPGGWPFLCYSSEAGVCFYTATPVSVSKAQYTLANHSRFMGFTSRPRLILSYHPPNDLLSESSKIQRSGSTTIIYAKHRRYNAATSNRYQVAIKITPGAITLVGYSQDGTTNLYWTELAEGSASDTAIQQPLIVAQGIGTTYELTATIGVLVAGRIAAASPLGVVNAVGTITPAGIMAAAGMLGVPRSVGAITVSGHVAAASPLRLPAMLGGIVPEGRIAAASPLGAAQSVGIVTVSGIGAVQTPLGAPAGVGFHDFSAQLGAVVSRYVMDLITPGGTVRVPVSSWQATIQTEQSSYAGCVVPACMPYVDALNAATEFVISRQAVRPGGASLEYEMARAPMGSLQYDRGPQRYTASISGYSAGLAAVADPPAIYDRELTGVRSVSRNGASIRVRCAVDWLLRPGHRAYLDVEPFVVDYINYYVQGGDMYCDVGSRG